MVITVEKSNCNQNPPGLLCYKKTVLMLTVGQFACSSHALACVSCPPYRRSRLGELFDDRFDGPSQSKWHVTRQGDGSAVIRTYLLVKVRSTVYIRGNLGITIIVEDRFLTYSGTTVE